MSANLCKYYYNQSPNSEQTKLKCKFIKSEITKFDFPESNHKEQTAKQIKMQVKQWLHLILIRLALSMHTDQSSANQCSGKTF